MTLTSPRPVTAPEPDATAPKPALQEEASPLGIRAPRERRAAKQHSRGVAIALYILLGFVFAVFAVPIYWLFSSSLKPESEIYTFPLTWIPSSLEWGNFADAWTSAPFGAFMRNSIITTVVGTALEIGVALLSACAFSFVRFRGKMVIFAVMVGSLMLPGHITLLVNYITVAQLGWLNTYQGLILPGIGSAFAMFLIYQQMRQVPGELVDAAKIDGAGHARRMWNVVAPAGCGRGARLAPDQHPSQACRWPRLRWGGGVGCWRGCAGMTRRSRRLGSARLSVCARLRGVVQKGGGPSWSLLRRVGSGGGPPGGRAGGWSRGRARPVGLSREWRCFVR